MQDKLFTAPIPGQSLTDEPQNRPYERPPETVDPEDALQRHISRINKPEVLDNVLDLMEMGIPINVLTESMLTSAVMAGIHTVPISMIIAPVIHEQLLTIAKEAGISYTEGFEEDTVAKQEKERTMLSLKLKKALGATPTEEQDEGFALATEVSQIMEEPTEEAAPAMEATPESGNLMSRRV